MNVFTEPDLKKAADSLNAAAPQGERLAYVNPQEESMLLGAGGAGVPTNESGVPSYFAWLVPALLGATGGAAISSMGSKAPTPPSGGETYESMAQAMLKNNPQLAQMMIDAFRGTGEYEGAGGVDMSRAQLEAQRELAPLRYAQQIAEMEEWGPQFMEQDRRLRQLSEPELFARQQEYYKDPYQGGPSPTDIYGTGPELSQIPDYEGLQFGRPLAGRRAPQRPPIDRDRYLFEGFSRPPDDRGSYLFGTGGPDPKRGGVVDSGNRPPIDYIDPYEGTGGPDPIPVDPYEGTGGPTPERPPFDRERFMEALLSATYPTEQGKPKPTEGGNRPPIDYIDPNDAPEWRGSERPIDPYRDTTELGAFGTTPGMRALLESEVYDRLALGERFTGEQERMLEQDILSRMGGKAILGGAPALRESQAKMEARGGLGRQRRGEALGLLASGQSVGDTARRDAALRADDAFRKFQSRMQQGQMQFGQQQARLAGQMGASEAQANRMAGFAGMPQVGGQMPFFTPQMQQGYQPNMGQVFGPAAGLAGSVYGQQMQEYMQPGIGSMLGQMGGAYLGTEAGAGAFGSALGGLFGNSQWQGTPYNPTDWP